MRVSNKGPKPVDLFLAAAKPLEENWVKLLGMNGFVIAGSKDKAESILRKAEEVGLEDFSYKLFEL